MKPSEYHFKRIRKLYAKYLLKLEDRKDRIPKDFIQPNDYLEGKKDAYEECFNILQQKNNFCHPYHLNSREKIILKEYLEENSYE